MREFTKSAVSFWLAGSLFGLQQVQNLLTPVRADEPKGPATRSLDRVTKAMLDQLGIELRSAFSILDNSQRFASSLAYNLLEPLVTSYVNSTVRQPAGDKEQFEPRPAAGLWKEGETRGNGALARQDPPWRSDFANGPAR